MLHIPQDQLVIIIRALSFYQIDLLKEGDVDNAAKVAKMLEEAAHNLKA